MSAPSPRFAPVPTEVIVAEAGEIRLGLRIDDAKAALQASVAIQLILAELDADWAEYSADIQAVSNQAEITDEQFWKLYEDNEAFGDDAQELVKTMYEVYAETVFSPEEGRALHFLAQERTHCEEIREEFILTAIAADPAEHHAALVEADVVFTQTLDVWLRNGPMFGIAPPPSPEAVAALEKVEADWKATQAYNAAMPQIAG